MHKLITAILIIAVFYLIQQVHSHTDWTGLDQDGLDKLIEETLEEGK